MEGCSNSEIYFHKKIENWIRILWVTRWDLLEMFLALEIVRKTNIFENRILFKQFSITKQELHKLNESIYCLS